MTIEEAIRWQRGLLVMVNSVTSEVADDLWLTEISLDTTEFLRSRVNTEISGNSLADPRESIFRLLWAMETMLHTSQVRYISHWISDIVVLYGSDRLSELMWQTVVYCPFQQADEDIRSVLYEVQNQSERLELASYEKLRNAQHGSSNRPGFGLDTESEGIDFETVKATIRINSFSLVWNRLVSVRGPEFLERLFAELRLPPSPALMFDAAILPFPSSWEPRLRLAGTRLLSPQRSS